MPKLPGRKVTRRTYPASSLQIESFVSTMIQDWTWKGKACVVREHQGPIVYAPDDITVLIKMAEEGRLSKPFSMTVLRDDEETRAGLACPDCTDLILGLGRGEPDDSPYQVDQRGNVRRK